LKKKGGDELELPPLQPGEVAVPGVTEPGPTPEEAEAPEAGPATAEPPPSDGVAPSAPADS
jgi:hypothetical protein